MDITLKSDLTLDYIINNSSSQDGANVRGKGTYKVENNNITIKATADYKGTEVSAEIVLTKTNWKIPTDGKFGQMKKYDAVAKYEGYPEHIKIEPDSNNFKVTSTTNDSPNFKMTLFPNGLAEMTDGGITTKFVWVFNDNVISIYQQNGMGVKKLDYRLMAGETL